MNSQIIGMKFDLHGATGTEPFPMHDAIKESEE